MLALWDGDPQRSITVIACDVGSGSDLLDNLVFLSCVDCHNSGTLTKISLITVF